MAIAAYTSQLSLTLADVQQKGVVKDVVSTRSKHSGQNNPTLFFLLFQINALSKVKHSHFLNFSLSLSKVKHWKYILYMHAALLSVPSSLSESCRIPHCTFTFPPFAHTYTYKDMLIQTSGIFSFVTFTSDAEAEVGESSAQYTLNWKSTHSRSKFFLHSISAQNSNTCAWFFSA